MTNKQRKIIKEVAEKLKNERLHPSEMTPEENRKRIEELKKQIIKKWERLENTPEQDLSAKEKRIKESYSKVFSKECLDREE